MGPCGFREDFLRFPYRVAYISSLDLEDGKETSQAYHIWRELHSAGLTARTWKVG